VKVAAALSAVLEQRTKPEAISVDNGNGRLRDECLNSHVFGSVVEAQLLDVEQHEATRLDLLSEKVARQLQTRRKQQAA